MNNFSPKTVTKLRDTLNEVFFLIDQKRYPKGSLIYDVGGDEHFVPHCTAIDPDSGLELAYIETLDEQSNSKVEELGKSYVELSKRQGFTIPVYLFSPSKSKEKQLRIFQLSASRGWEAISNEEFPSFDTLSSSRKRKNFVTEKEKKMNAADKFSGECGRLATLMLVLFICSIVDGIEITQIDLFLLVGIVVVIALPHYETIKALNVEFRRRKS